MFYGMTWCLSSGAR